MIIPATFFEGGKVGHQGILDIPDAEVRRMVESVTQGVEVERPCKTCFWNKVLSSEEPCLSCSDDIAHPDYKPRQTPPAEDSLTKAESEKFDIFKDVVGWLKYFHDRCAGQDFDYDQKVLERRIGLYESAIRERDEAIEKLDMEKVIDKTTIDTLKDVVESLQAKMSQMMTVEEVCKWNSQMTEEDENYTDYLRQKIKERNDGGAATSAR